MINYVGVKCPVCNKRFTQADDIVVCPLCGAPHHRDCYAKTGECAYMADHISGKEWQPEEGAAPPESEQQPEQGGAVALCPQCGAANPTGAVFCQVCGQMMTAQRCAQSNAAQGRYQPFGDPFGGVAKDETVGGQSVSDVMYYLGPNSAYYISRFYAFEKMGRKILMNFSAFVFHFLYFFYRKMYLIGTVLFILFVAGLIPSFLWAKVYFPEYLFLLGLGPKVAIDLDVLEQYTRLANVVGWISLALRVWISCVATRFYYNKVVRDVSAVVKDKDENPAHHDYHTTLISSGGVDKISVTLLIFVMAVGLFLFSNLLASSVS